MYKEKIVSGINGEETLRNYTAAEIAQVEVAKAEAAARVAEAETKATAKASALAKLAALGLSADEIAAL